MDGSLYLGPSSWWPFGGQLVGRARMEFVRGVICIGPRPQSIVFGTIHNSRGFGVKVTRELGFVTWGDFC